MRAQQSPTLHLPRIASVMDQADVVVGSPTGVAAAMEDNTSFAPGLVVLSRTSCDSGDQHNADLCTICRVRSVCDLAMDLHRGGLCEQSGEHAAAV